MATLAQLNQKIAPLGYECVKDYDYFWFTELGNVMVPGPPPPSVYVRRFNDLSLDAWIKHVTDWHNGEV